MIFLHFWKKKRVIWLSLKKFSQALVTMEKNQYYRCLVIFCYHKILNLGSILLCNIMNLGSMYSCEILNPPLNIELCGFNILWPWYIEPPSAFHLLLEKGAQNIRLHWYYLFEKLIFNRKYVTHTSWFNLHVVVPSFVLTFWYNLNHQSLILSNCYWIFFKRPKYFFKVEITDYFCEVKRIWCSELLK